MSERRRCIVQICSSGFPPNGEDGGDTGPDWLYVLCDDGTVWMRKGTLEGKWLRFPDVPQEDERSEEACP